VTSTATDGAGAPGSGAGPQASGGGPGAGLRDRSRLLPTPVTRAAVPLLWAVLGVALSLALLSVAAVVVPVPDVRVGPLASVPGSHDFAVLQFLALVGGAGGALSVGLLRGAAPRTEATLAGPAVDRTALRIGRSAPAVLRVLGAGVLVWALVLVPAWLGLLPIGVVGLVLPFGVALCTPSIVVRRLVAEAERARGLRVVAPGALAAALGHLVLAGPQRPAGEPVIVEGELLPPAPPPFRG
jgi:hypothetical protein